MSNISPINKAQRLTEAEVHAAAEELQETNGKVSSIELYKHLGRGSLTTITNFLKTWQAGEEQPTTLPALINLPESLKTASEQLIIKVWAESQKLAESELQTQREALQQAKAMAGEKIEEAQAFSEEQAKQIEELKNVITELENGKYEALDKAINEKKHLAEEITRLQINEGILNEKIKEEQTYRTEQFNKIKELKSEIKRFEQEKQLETDKARKIERALEADKAILQTEISIQKEKNSALVKTEEGNKEKIKKIEIHNENQAKRLMSENKTLANQRDQAIKEAAKLEGELNAWKTLKPKTENKD